MTNIFVSLKFVMTYVLITNSTANYGAFITDIFLLCQRFQCFAYYKPIKS